MAAQNDENATKAVMKWFRAPPSVYFNYASTMEALTDLQDAKCHRAFVISDRAVHTAGYTKYVIDRLTALDIESELYSDVEAPSAATVNVIQKSMRVYQPDCIIGLGGGVVLDMAKIARFIYNPSKPIVDLKELYAYDHKQLLTSQTEPTDRYVKKLVCIPTSSGTGSEMTPIAWVQEPSEDSKKLPLKRPVVSWAMTPEIAINDGYFTHSLPPNVAASGGLCALTIAIESLTSQLASDYTRALSIQAAKLVFQNLPKSYAGEHEAREACHRAASIAGLASANAFVGIAYGAGFVLANYVEARRGKKLPQGVANSLVLPEVIRFNGSKSDDVARQYTVCANQAFRLQADLDPPEGSILLQRGVETLASGVDKLRKEVGCGLSLASYIPKEEMEANVEQIAADCLRVVGCAATNAVEVTAADMKKILIAAVSS